MCPTLTTTSYQKAIAEGSSLSRLSEALKIESKEFVYRAYVALGQYNIVLGEVQFIEYY